MKTFKTEMDTNNTMKKVIITTMVMAFAISVNAVGLYIPQGNPESLAYAPLNKGESCWIPESETTGTVVDEETGETEDVVSACTLYIGNGTTKPMRVVDPGALRGTCTKELSDNEIAIGTDPYFTTTGDGIYTTTHMDTWMNGTNSVHSVSGQVYIAVGSQYVIDKITYDTETPSFGIGMTYRIDEDENLQGNKCTYTFKSENGCTYIKIKNIKVTVRSIGEDDYVNDLMTRTWKLKDEYGTFDFADLRYWTTHLYDGNRGEHWSNYKSLNNVFLDDHKIYFDSDLSSVISYSTKKFNFSMWGVNAMQIVEGDPDGTYTGELRIIGINKLDSTFQLSYYQAIKKDGVASFDPTQLIVKYAPSLDANSTGNIAWEFLINGADFTVTDLGDGTGTCDIPYNIANKAGFYQLIYKGNLSSIMRIDFNSPVYIKKGLYLTGEDGVVYKISVNNGVISATAQ